MEYNLLSKQIPTQQTLLDTVAEQPVDIDFTLPDYCPDIEKILKCSLVIKIFNRNISGGQLIVEGSSTVRVLYCDSVKKNIRCSEQSLPFSASFNLKNTPEQYIIFTDAKSEYINCRALSPRRLVIHGAFSLYARVISKGTVAICTPSDDMNLELKKERVSTAQLCAFCQELFNFSEEAELSNQAPVEAILRDSVTANITECKAITNKLMVNGEVNVKMLYLSSLDTGETQQIDYLMPFSRIIDCEGADENITNNLDISVLSYDVRIKPDHITETPVIIVDAKIAISETGYKETEEEIIADAYSTEIATQTDLKQISIAKSVTQLCETVMNKSSIKIENSKITRIIDIYNEYCTVTPIISQEEITLSGKANICIFALDGDNMPIYVERTLDFEHKCALTDEAAVSSAKAKIKSISFRIADDSTVEIKAETVITARLCVNNLCSLVTQIRGEEDKKIVKDDCSLVIYYGKKGERLWNISKYYSTKHSMLKDENPDAGEVLEGNMMLLIPTV
ncbi:MAG: DUF3794 domain-containing protein [Acutalibacteraceae bacterium]